MEDIPKQPSLYEYHDVETDKGMSFTTNMESLIRAANLPGAGQTCPRCSNHGTLFFGDPDGDHWCAACQIAADFDLEREDAANA